MPSFGRRSKPTPDKDNDEIDVTSWADQDLDKILPLFLSHYNKITGANVDLGATFQNIQEDIGNDLKKCQSTRSQHARKVINRVGSCLQTFGEIAASGASIVFGPTTQCWNAISLIIRSVQKYPQALDGFVTLMERCSAFLERLNAFLITESSSAPVQERLPKGLRKQAYGILFHFLEVLASSQNLVKSKAERWKITLGIVLFNADDSVAGSLERLEYLVEQFTKAQIDEIQRDLKGLARWLRDTEEVRKQKADEIEIELQANKDFRAQMLTLTQSLKDTSDGRTDREQHKENLHKIRRGLSLKPSDPWVERHTKISSTREHRTGEWILEEISFKQWSDVTKQTIKVLSMRADTGSGKSHAINYIISYLEKKYSTGSNQAFVAYYYYSDDKDESLERCIGSIICQIALKNESYAKEVATVCDSPTNVARSKDRWRTLVRDMYQFMKGTYYICIDGYDGLNRAGDAIEAIEMIANEALSDEGLNGVQIRLLVSSTGGTFSDTLKATPSFSTISFNNSRDLVLVTKSRIDRINRDRPELRAVLTAANVQRLIADIHSYNDLEAKISQIEACDTEKKVQDVIDNSGDDWNALLQANVEALNKSLSLAQIQQLNEMLIWIVGSNNNPTVTFLQNVLFFKFKEKLFLKTAIRSTYKVILAVDEESGAVKLSSEKFLRILSTVDHQPTGLRFELEGTITQPEIEMCSHFVRNACGEKYYDKFRFDDFFGALSGRQKPRIHVNEDSLPLAMTTSCINVLHQRVENVELEPFRAYASVWFYEHLKRLVEERDLLRVDSDSLTSLGSKLVDLFYEEQYIDSWFKEASFIELRRDWITKKELLISLVEFWKTAYIAKGFAVSEEKNLWVRSIISEPANRKVVLGRIAIHLARIWFSCKTTTDTGYLFIPFDIFTDATDGTIDEDNSPPVFQVIKFLQWAKEAVHADIEDPIWDYRTGVAFTMFGQHSLAIRSLKRAEMHLASHIGLIRGLSRSYEKLKDFEKSLEYTKKLKKIDAEEDDPDSPRLIDTILREGKCYKELKQYASAASCFQESLAQKSAFEVGPDYAHAVQGLFTCWVELREYQSIIDMLQGWAHGKGKDQEFLEWFKITSLHDMHNCVILAAKRANAVETVRDIYRRALSQLTLEEPNAYLNDWTKRQLRYYEAALMSYVSQQPSDQDEGIKLWEQIIDDGRSDQSVYGEWTMLRASRSLAQCLLNSATPKEPNTCSQEKTASYATKLRELLTLHHPSIHLAFQGPKDLRLCSIRLAVLNNDLEAAVIEAKDRFIRIFDEWPDDPEDKSLALRFQNLASTLTALDDDENAIVAWQAVKHSPQPASIDTGSTPADKPIMNIDDLRLKMKQITDSTPKPPTFYVTGYSCDSCSVSWHDVVADVWTCKHCLCVQFCANCYQKRGDDDFRFLLCKKSHEMLYLPLIDPSRMKDLSPDTVTINGQIIPRRQWLIQLQEKYGVTQNEINEWKIRNARRMDATARLAGYMLRWFRKVQSRRKTSDPNGVLSISDTKTTPQAV